MTAVVYPEEVLESPQASFVAFARTLFSATDDDDDNDDEDDDDDAGANDDDD